MRYKHSILVEFSLDEKSKMQQMPHTMILCELRCAVLHSNLLRYWVQKSASSNLWFCDLLPYTEQDNGGWVQFSATSEVCCNVLLQCFVRVGFNISP